VRSQECQLTEILAGGICSFPYFKLQQTILPLAIVRVCFTDFFLSLFRWMSISLGAQLLVFIGRFSQKLDSFSCADCYTVSFIVSSVKIVKLHKKAV
jgi:hypothetical protein